MASRDRVGGCVGGLRALGPGRRCAQRAEPRTANKGAWDEFIPRYDSAIKMNPSFAAAYQNKEVGCGQFVAQLARTDSVRWPRPVAKHYLGTITAEQLLAASGRTDSKVKSDQRCAMAFYPRGGAMVRSRRRKPLPGSRKRATAVPTRGPSARVPSRNSAGCAPTP